MNIDFSTKLALFFRFPLQWNIFKEVNGGQDTNQFHTSLNQDLETAISSLAWSTDAIMLELMSLLIWSSITWLDMEHLEQELEDQASMETILNILECHSDTMTSINPIAKSTTTKTLMRYSYLEYWIVFKSLWSLYFYCRLEIVIWYLWMIWMEEATTLEEKLLIISMIWLTLESKVSELMLQSICGLEIWKQSR